MDNRDDMATDTELAEFLRKKDEIEKGIRWTWKKVYALYLLGAIFLAWLIFGL